MNYLCIPLIGLFIVSALDPAGAWPILDRVRARVAERNSRTDQAPSQSVMSIDVNGVERQYILHLPASYRRANGALPLVLFFHGGKSEAEGMDRLTGFNAMADKNNFIIVYPKGIDQRWNDGRGSPEAAADDVGFVRVLIDRLVREGIVDSRRVYATGISNGAMLTHLLACELSDAISAIAPVAGTIPTDVSKRSRPTRPVPVMMIHGTKDPLILWDGGTGEKRGQIGGSTLSVPDSIKFWVSKNGCRAIPPIVRELNTARDGTTATREEYCPNVILYKVENGGHTWPGGRQYAPALIIGKTSRDFQATQAIWDFFKAHSRS